MSKNTRDVRLEFYMSFFDQEEGYEEKEVNGFWLIKQWQGNENKWKVSLYPKESYKNYKIANDLFSEQKLGFENAMNKEE